MTINSTLRETIHFLIGPISPTLTTAMCFCLASCITRVVQQGFLGITLIKICKRILSYLMFLLIANRMDAMGLNMLLGWQGTTQLLVAAWIAITEVKNIFLAVKQFGEVDPPAIISERFSAVQIGLAGHVDSHNLDEQIRNLKENMDKLKELVQLQTHSTIAANNTQILLPPTPVPEQSFPVTPTGSKSVIVQ